MGIGRRISNEKKEQEKKITQFECPDDPIREILGRGMDSNPEEQNRIIKELQNSGVEIICREGVLGYAPHPSISGEPGQFLIDPNASILAISALFLVKNKFALERFNQIYNNLNSNDKFLVDNFIKGMQENNNK